MFPYFPGSGRRVADRGGVRGLNRVRTDPRGPKIMSAFFFEDQKSGAILVASWLISHQNGPFEPRPDEKSRRTRGGAPGLGQALPNPKLKPKAGRWRPKAWPLLPVLFQKSH